MSYTIVMLIAAVLISFALACQTYSAWKINSNNRRYDEIAKLDRNLFVKFASEAIVTMQAEKTARLAEAELHRCAIKQACKYQQAGNDNGLNPN